MHTKQVNKVFFVPTLAEAGQCPSLWRVISRTDVLRCTMLSLVKCSHEKDVDLMCYCGRISCSLVVMKKWDLSIRMKFLMRQASSKRACLSVGLCVRPCVCHTFLHICKEHTCDVIMYLLSHHWALRSCFNVILQTNFYGF